MKYRITSLNNPSTRRDSLEWWILCGRDSHGPYDTKKEAAEARRGLQRFDEHENDRSFFTSEPEPTR